MSGFFGAVAFGLGGLMVLYFVRPKDSTAARAVVIRGWNKVVGFLCVVAFRNLVEAGDKELAQNSRRLVEAAFIALLGYLGLTFISPFLAFILGGVAAFCFSNEFQYMISKTPLEKHFNIHRDREPTVATQAE